MNYDLIVVGAGIVGLAHALEGTRRGLRVAVIERDHRCVGASIRNFGFITVTGQPAGDTWRRARASRDIWLEVAQQAGIPIEHRGLWMIAHRPQALSVLQAFMRTDMAEGNRLLEPRVAALEAPELNLDQAQGVMHSPHEIRVESRTAIPRLARWLAQSRGVDFHFGETVLEVAPPRVRTAQRLLNAERVIVCPGTELNGVGSEVLRPIGLRLTRLQMLRVKPEPGMRLSGAVMSDLSLVRYGGYAALPESAGLKDRLLHEEGPSLDAGIHLIVVQSADGSLVIGDSHHDSNTPEPFASEAVDELILKHASRALRSREWRVTERWTGVYPTGAASDCVIGSPDPCSRVVVVTSGTGASTAFGIAREVFDEW
jgi:FAD dependent oxidoreductase TIGR03364